MRVFIVFFFLVIVTITALFLAMEEQEPAASSKNLEMFHEKFSKIDLNDANLDLDVLIQELKAARKQYPLDDKLKMIDIRLEHQKANQLQR